MSGTYNKTFTFLRENGVAILKSKKFHFVISMTFFFAT